MTNDKTTITVDKELRDDLRDARTSTESSYSETIRRLLADSGERRMWSEDEIEARVETQVARAIRLQSDGGD